MNVEITLPFNYFISEDKLKNNPYLIVVCKGTPTIFDSYENREQAMEANKIIQGTIITNPYFIKKVDEDEDDDESQPHFSYYQT